MQVATVAGAAAAAAVAASSCDFSVVECLPLFAVAVAVASALSLHSRINNAA